jgi:outer membrane lipoprotein SlyB
VRARGAETLAGLRFCEPSSSALDGPADLEGASMSARLSHSVTARRARSSLFASSALSAAIAAFALTACGPRDESPLAGGAAAVAPQTSAAPVLAQTPNAAPVANAPVPPLQGQPGPVAQVPAQSGAPAPAYAPAPVTVAAAQPGYAQAPQYAPTATPTYPADSPQYQPAPVARPAAPVAQAVPSNRAGSIENIAPITERPQGSGAGAVIGGVLGAVVGNQFGHGLGRAAMTGVGAAGGAVAGNNVERNYKKGVVGYRVSVRLDNGQMRTFQRTSIGSLHVGDRVRLDQSSFHRV